MSVLSFFFFFSSRRRHTRFDCDWSSDVCSSDLTLVAPIIPFLNDKDMEAVLEAVSDAGARMAGYTLLRLPWEVKDLFKDWLGRDYPLKAKHVMARIRDIRGGRDNDPQLGSRIEGGGQVSE